MNSSSDLQDHFSQYSIIFTHRQKSCDRFALLCFRFPFVSRYANANESLHVGTVQLYHSTSSHGHPASTFAS